MALNEEYTQIGKDIIGAAFEVKKIAGRGLRESFYEAALAWELRQRGYKVDQQVKIGVVYKGIEIADAYQADLVVDGKVIIELKAISILKEREERQLYTYLKLSGFQLGYLINFGAKDFCIGNLRNETYPYDKGIYRIVNNI